MPNYSATWRRFGTASRQQPIDIGTKTAEDSHMNDPEIRLGRYRPIPDKGEGYEPCLILDRNNANLHIDLAFLLICRYSRRGITCATVLDP